MNKEVLITILENMKESIEELEEDIYIGRKEEARDLLKEINDTIALVNITINDF